MICQLSDWIISVHDAFIISPNNAHKVREWFADGLRQMYKDRKNIRKQYFESIGIKEDYPDVNGKELDTSKFSGYCLK